MEQKVQVLVDNLTESASAVLQAVAAQDELMPSNEENDDGNRGLATRLSAESSPADPHALPKPKAADKKSTSSAAASQRALTKDVSQLRRLVQATISALRTAEAEDEARSTRGSSPPPIGRGAVQVQGDGGDGKELDTNNCRGDVNPEQRQAVSCSMRSDRVVGCPPMGRRSGQEPTDRCIRSSKSHPGEDRSKSGNPRAAH